MQRVAFVGLMTLVLKVLAYVTEPHTELFAKLTTGLGISTELMGMHVPVYAAAATTILLVLIGAVSFSREYFCVPLALSLPELFIIGGHFGFLNADLLSRGALPFLVFGVVAGTVVIRDMGNLWRIRSDRMLLTVRVAAMLALFNAGVYALYSFGGKWQSTLIAILCGLVASGIFIHTWIKDEDAKQDADRISEKLEGAKVLERALQASDREKDEVIKNRDEWQDSHGKLKTRVEELLVEVGKWMRQTAIWKEKAEAWNMADGEMPAGGANRSVVSSVATPTRDVVAAE